MPVAAQDNGLARGAKKRTYRDQVFRTVQITRKVSLPMSAVGNKYRDVLQKMMRHKYEGKCCSDGCIRRNSIRIIDISSGKLERDGLVTFTVTASCDACYLAEGDEVECIVRSRTQTGLRVEYLHSTSEDPTPFVGFLMPEHNTHVAEAFANAKEGDRIVVQVIAQRLLLNEHYVWFVGELHAQKTRELNNQMDVV